MASKRKGSRRGWWIALVVVAAAGAAAGLRFYPRSGNTKGVPTGVQIGAAETGAIQQRISATGVVAAQIGAMVKIGSQITGRIRRLPADVGTQVVANQVVAELDLPDLDAQVLQQRHRVAEAEAGLEQARSRLRQAAENAGFSRDQTDAQIAEADAALKAAQAHVESSAATAKLQPTQTASEISRAEAALSTARSVQKQVEQTSRQQVQQAQSSIDDAKVVVTNTRRTLTRGEGLLRQGFIAAQDVDNMRTSWEQAKAKLDSSTANLDIIQEKTRADLQSAKDQVAQAQAALESARAGTLQNSVREAELRNAQQALRQAEATLRLRHASRSEDRIRQMAIGEARSAVAQAQAALLEARSMLTYQLAQLDKTIIRSPISGTVLSITAQQGETVAAGLAAPTLITVADLNRLEVRAYVDETDIGRVRLGVPAEVRVESYTNRIFHGKVTKIASSSTIKDNVVTYETTIAIRDADGLLRPDMTADVGLILGTRDGVILVPSEAIHREPTRSIVYVLHREREGAERAEVRVVDPGSDTGTKTEVRSGLKPGEEVILAGASRLGVRVPDSQRGGPGGK